ncbi:MAG: hypothetical protein FWC97_05695 [Treponema sp.]|nr:hypothetical protein [Treponema sp.]
MKLKALVVSCILFVFFSCTTQVILFIPEPDFSVFTPARTIEIGNIIETKSGASEESLPEWLSAFLWGGVAAVENLEDYSEKYVFIAVNQGESFVILNKWADNFSATRDIAVLAGNRVEERMILDASLFPDDEYGEFFQIFIKNAYGAEYQAAEKEAIYWIKHSSSPVYTFFVKMTIDKSIMQSTIRRMMAHANAVAAPTGAQAVSVNRLRQTFFTGF